MSRYYPGADKQIGESIPVKITCSYTGCVNHHLRESLSTARKIAFAVIYVQPGKQVRSTRQRLIAPRSNDQIQIAISVFIDKNSSDTFKITVFFKCLFRLLYKMPIRLLNK